MPGLPAVGGWGGSNRTLGIEMEGFTTEEIAKAVDHCDNDRIRTIKYLTALKTKGGGHNWKKEVEKRLPSMDPQVRALAQRLMGYDNVPVKQKAFVNFAKNSLALQRQPQMADKLWEAVADLMKKPAAPPPAAKPKEEDKEEEEEEKPKKKKEKKEKKKAESDEEEEEEEEKPKKKKEKKEKKKAESDEEEEEEETAAARRKAEKKEKKKAAKKDKASEEDDDKMDVDGEAEDGGDEKKKKKKKKKAESEDEEEAPAKEEKKKKKKDKKKESKESEEGSDGEEESPKKRKREEEEEGSKKKKKKDKKKDKKAESDDEEEEQAPAKSGGGGQFDFYKESKGTKNLSKKEVDAFRADKEIAIENFNLNPILSFADLNVDPKLKAVTDKFEKPTPIQASCWPVCLSGSDLVGIAETGSGKTLAFGMPGLTHIKELGQAKSRTPVMLVIAPTRELAMQSAVVLEAAGNTIGVSSLCVYGGVPKHDQRAALKKGVQVLVATPGRLMDLMQEKACDVSKVSFLVLDEADRMLDMGFEQDMRTIIKECRKDRQTVMFSATWPQSIQQIASEFLKKKPARITVGSADLSANHRVKQIVEVVDPAGKDRRLVEMLSKYHDRKNRIIIFVLYKMEADRVHRLVEGKGYNVLAIHGDRTQEQRSAAVEKFKAGTVPLLIATDVAARGLDIPGVEYVLNYTFPLTTEDYVHRIGRTGRAGKTGVAHTLFTMHDKTRAGELVNVLREANQDVPEELTKFGTHVKKKEHKLFGAHFKDVDMSLKATKKTFDDSDDDE